MTYVGAPHIYYGDEVGHGGRQGPRLPASVPLGLREGPVARRAARLLQEAHRARGTPTAALRTGDFRTVHAEGKLYAYVRSQGDEHFLVALNAGMQPASLAADLSYLGKSLKATDVITGAVETWSAAKAVSAAIPAESGRVWKLEPAGR